MASRCADDNSARGILIQIRSRVTYKDMTSLCEPMRHLGLSVFLIVLVFFCLLPTTHTTKGSEVPSESMATKSRPSTTKITILVKLVTRIAIKLILVQIGSFKL